MLRLRVAGIINIMIQIGTLDMHYCSAVQCFASLPLVALTRCVRGVPPFYMCEFERSSNLQFTSSAARIAREEKVRQNRGVVYAVYVLDVMHRRVR